MAAESTILLIAAKLQTDDIEDRDSDVQLNTKKQIVLNRIRETH